VLKAIVLTANSDARQNFKLFQGLQAGHLRSVSSRKPKQPESDLPAPRKELVARLGDCIERLQKVIATPYAGASSLDCWPTVDELNRLATAVAQLGRAIKITKVDFEHLDRVMRHLDRRYPKLGLLAFFDGLVRKLESIPVGPVTRINQKLAAGVEPSSKKQLLAIRDLLTSLEWKVEAKAGTWKELGPLLFDLSGGQIREARKKSKPATKQDIDFKEADKMFDEAFGLAAFLEVQRQHFVWRLRWNRKVLPTAEWIYLLHNPDWDNRLRRIFENPNITPADSKADEKKFQERMKKRSYRKSQTGS
jgi:hypothetical protein